MEFIKDSELEPITGGEGDVAWNFWYSVGAVCRFFTDNAGKMDGSIGIKN